MPVTLVLGGARSGKSAFAHRAAEKVANTGNTLVMIATAEALDTEMKARIAQHQAERGGAWRTVEAPIELATAIKMLVDALQSTPATVWVVSNEVGWGIVPDNALARQFRDACGRLHQKVAHVADGAVMIVAGLPLKLK